MSMIRNRCQKLDTTVQNTHTIVRADGVSYEETGTIIKEQYLDIWVQEQLVMKLVCTPTDLENLVVGRLCTERIINDKEDIDQIDLCESGNRARVFLKKNIIFEKSKQYEPTCCTNNENKLQIVKQENDFAKRKRAYYEKEWIFHVIQAFSEGSMIHKKTKGTHSCYLAVEDKLCYAVEDIGRHNALDKAIGYMVLHDLPREKCILFTTGRVPTDMVQKVIQAGVGTLVSKAVPTDEAVKLAKEYNLNLICKAWPDSFEIFS